MGRHIQSTKKRFIQEFFIQRKPFFKHQGKIKLPNKLKPKEFIASPTQNTKGSLSHWNKRSLDSCSNTHEEIKSTSESKGHYVLV